MEFDMKHVMNAIIFGVVFWVLTWLFALIKIPVVWAILMLPVAVGALLYFFKDVKGVMNGIMNGIVYGVIFVVIGIILTLIPGFAGKVPFFEGVLFSLKPVTMFDWGEFGIWMPLISFLILTGIIGWVNEQK